MNNTQPTNFLQRWNAIQYDLIPELKEEVGHLTPKLEKLIHILEWVSANGRLKDEFGGRFVRVHGSVKVMSHLMFGVLVLAADQLMRLMT